MQVRALTSKKMRVSLRVEGVVMTRDNGGIKSGERPADAPPFRDLLSAALDATGTGQSELARKIGRTEAAVSQWLRKGDMPGLDVVIKIEDTLSLPFGAMVRHVSPDVWTIIEVKTGQPAAPDPETKFKEALFGLPLDNQQRRILRDILRNYLEINLLLGNAQPVHDR